MSAEAPVSPPKKSGKRMIAVIAMVIFLGGGGAGFWYFMSLRNTAALAQLEEGNDTAHMAESKKHDKTKKPIFTTLENFTVNLNDPGGMHLAQIGITLEVENADVDTAIKDHLPIVRNRILFLISSKKIEDLLTLDGKSRLARQIQAAIAQSIGIDIKMDDGAPETAPIASQIEGMDTGSPHQTATQNAGKPVGKKRPVLNPIKEVLFSTFIVQ